MAYHTALYIFVFLPIALLTYRLTPQKYRWLTLLAAGYVFFWSFSKWLVLYLMGTTAFTYGIGWGISKLKEDGKEKIANASKETKAYWKTTCKRREKAVLIFGIAVLLGLLGYLKYSNFFIINARQLAEHWGVQLALHTRKLLMPIGISFYTLQAIGYLADVYWGKVESYRHPGKLALFLSFFPQIMEGPIAMYSQTADQLWEGKAFDMDDLIRGGIRILWGLFKKMLIADRLNAMVGFLYGSYQNFEGIIIILAAVSYTVQLYMEFSGSMDIIIGSGWMFGINLPENFRQPFFAKNASEFWRRWHISLGTWFKTYIFYPVSVSGPVKKWNKFGRKHLNKYVTMLGISAFTLFPVWLCNGLWHGPRWSYIMYGMYYFVILFMENALQPATTALEKKLHLNGQNKIYNVLRMMKTWIIIVIGELFFRADSLGAGIAMFTSIFKGLGTDALWNGTLYGIGMDQADVGVVILGCLVVLIVDTLRERNLISCTKIMELRLPARWVVYYGLIFAIIIFGAYGAGYQQVDLIYAGF